MNDVENKYETALANLCLQVLSLQDVLLEKGLVTENELSLSYNKKAEELANIINEMKNEST
jgi:hypothetical protein